MLPHYLGKLEVPDRYLTNTNEPSLCGGDAASCQISLTTCYDDYVTTLVELRGLTGMHAGVNEIAAADVVNHRRCRSLIPLRPAV